MHNASGLNACDRIELTHSTQPSQRCHRGDSQFAELTAVGQVYRDCLTGTIPRAQ